MPASPGTALYIGPDGGPFTVVGSSNALPVTANAGTGSFNVIGPVAAGNPPGQPVQIGVSDGTNVRNARGDASGYLQIGVPNNVGLLKFKKQNLQGLQALKASAGQLFTLKCVNSTASAIFVQIFDVASASVTLGTTIADYQTLVPANTLTPLPVESFGVNGFPFGTAISIAATTAIDGATTAATGLDVYASYI